MGVGSENRKEKGGKMSVYSTKKSQSRMLTLKIRVFESNMGVGSENRKEKGGKMSEL